MSVEPGRHVLDARSLAVTRFWSRGDGEAVQPAGDDGACPDQGREPWARLLNLAVPLVAVMFAPAFRRSAAWMQLAAISRSSRLRHAFDAATPVVPEAFEHRRPCQLDPDHRAADTGRVRHRPSA